MTVDRPILNLHVEQKLNTGNYESLTVSIGLSRLPFDAPDVVIDETLGTADRAVERIRGRLRERIAAIRMEERYPAPRPALAFSPVPDTEEAPEDDPDCPFPGPYSPPPAIDWGEVGGLLGRLHNAEIDVESLRTDPPTWAVRLTPGGTGLVCDVDALRRLSDQHGVSLSEPQRRCRGCGRASAKDEGRWPQIDLCPLCGVASVAPSRDVPDEDDVLADVEVFGVRLPLVEPSGWRRPLTGQVDNTDQMLALNAGLTSVGHRGAARHRAVEAIANGYLRAFAEPDHGELLITTLREVPFAAAHLVLTWLDRAAQPGAGSLPLSLLAQAVSRLRGQGDLASVLL